MGHTENVNDPLDKCNEKEFTWLVEKCGSCCEILNHSYEILTWKVVLDSRSNIRLKWEV